MRVLDRIFSLFARVGKQSKAEEGAYRRHPLSTPEIEEDIALVRANTMLTHPRLISLHQQVRACERQKIKGAFVECGTWKGGAVGLMALANLRYGGTRRMLHLFDSFEGIPEPDASVDGALAVEQVLSVQGGIEGRLVAVQGLYEKYAGSVGTLQDNQQLLEKTIGYPVEFIRYHRGWFQDTVPTVCDTIGPIAILRLDGDWHASTKVCLDHLYPNVVSGGFVIVDDYGTYDGCRKAVDDYRQAHHIHNTLEKIDNSAYFWIKAE